MSDISEIKDTSAYIYHNNLTIEGMTQYTTNNVTIRLELVGSSSFSSLLL